MDCLKVLAVGSVSRLTSVLEQAGHVVLPVPDFEEASEALLVQRFDVVLVAPDISGESLAAFSATLKDLERAHDWTRTPILSVVPDVNVPTAASQSDMFDGTVDESLDPDALTLAIARLASAVAVDKSPTRASALPPELPILDVETLKEQVAYDSELLVELIDLYLSERLHQSVEMAETLAAGNYQALSRVAHTIKGSLGSLHAPAARVIAQHLELAAREDDAASCRDFLPVFEQQLDLLDIELKRLRSTLTES